MQLLMNIQAKLTSKNGVEQLIALNAAHVSQCVVFHVVVLGGWGERITTWTIKCTDA